MPGELQAGLQCAQRHPSAAPKGAHSSTAGAALLRPVRMNGEKRALTATFLSYCSSNYEAIQIVRYAQITQGTPRSFAGMKDQNMKHYSLAYLTLTLQIKLTRPEMKTHYTAKQKLRICLCIFYIVHPTSQIWSISFPKHFSSSSYTLKDFMAPEV